MYVKRNPPPLRFFPTWTPQSTQDVQLDALQPHPLLHSNCTRLWKLVLGVFGRCKYFEAPEHGRAYLHAAMRRVWVLASEWPLESGFESPLMLLRMWLKSPLVDSVVPCCALADAARDLSQSDTSCAKVRGGSMYAICAQLIHLKLTCVLTAPERLMLCMDVNNQIQHQPNTIAFVHEENHKPMCPYMIWSRQKPPSP